MSEEFNTTYVLLFPAGVVVGFIIAMAIAIIMEILQEPDNEPSAQVLEFIAKTRRDERRREFDRARKAITKEIGRQKKEEKNPRSMQEGSSDK